MTSKELNEILNKTRRTPNISLTPEQVEEIINDLEVLEIFIDGFNHMTSYSEILISDEDEIKIRKWLNGD